MATLTADIVKAVHPHYTEEQAAMHAAAHNAAEAVRELAKGTVNEPHVNNVLSNVITMIVATVQTGK